MAGQNYPALEGEGHDAMCGADHSIECQSRVHARVSEFGQIDFSPGARHCAIFWN